MSLRPNATLIYCSISEGASLTYEWRRSSTISLTDREFWTLVHGMGFWGALPAGLPVPCVPARRRGRQRTCAAPALGTVIRGRAGMADRDHIKSV
jgi:hypothetical protein